MNELSSRLLYATLTKLTGTPKQTRKSQKSHGWGRKKGQEEKEVMEVNISRIYYIHASMWHHEAHNYT